MGTASKQPPQCNIQCIFPRQHRLRSRLRAKAHLHNRHVQLQSLPHSLARPNYLLGTMDPLPCHAQAPCLRHRCSATMLWRRQWSDMWSELVKGSSMGWHPRSRTTNGCHVGDLYEPLAAAISRSTPHKCHGRNQRRESQRRIPKCSESRSHSSSNTRR
jgi:hypothetical protein